MLKTPCLTIAVSMFTWAACTKPGPGNPNTGLADESANYIVTTFVGGGKNGFDPQTNGPAMVYFPCGNTVDAQGNLYIADAGNDKIRKVTPSGTMTTIAGSFHGYADGSGTNAMFMDPLHVALDASGNLFVAEGNGARIRKITPAGVVTTIAGSGVSGCVDGTGTAAQIDRTGGMVVDQQGNIYFTQQNFHGIRKITPAGVVSTFVGSSTSGYQDGTGTAARFSDPFTLTTDAAGNIYVADNINAAIRRVTPAGVVSTFLKLKNPNEMRKIALDKDNNFYIVQGDATYTEIYLYDKQGSLSKIAGHGMGYVDGSGDKAQFSFCSGLSVDANGALYFSDLLSDVIRKIVKK